MTTKSIENLKQQEQRIENFYQVLLDIAKTLRKIEKNLEELLQDFRVTH